jgi:REP element-mobilizing transposase RayT
MHAKPSKQTYERNLPHIQAAGRPIFVTFCTYQRWILPEEVRDRVLAHCLHDHGKKLWMHAAIVMPDHSHLLFTPMNDSTGATFGLAEIMSGIKGASAHSVNRMLKRTGHVWQDESFDHVLRSDESVHLKAEYICENPVRRKLVKSVDEYRWLWREWVEGSAQ